MNTTKNPVRFIVINRYDADHCVVEEILPCDTEEDMRAASVALREAGIAQAAVWTGDEGESVKTSLVLSADTSEPDDTAVFPRHNAYGWHVVDMAGGKWWPGEEAAAEIEASDDPAAAVVRICVESPLRGEWAQ